MGLSRRKFTTEFKLAAIERLEAGASVAAATQYCPQDCLAVFRAPY